MIFIKITYILQDEGLIYKKGGITLTKKIIFFLAVLFIGIYKANALEPTIEYQENLYSNRVTEDKTYSGQLGFIILDGKIVYCLEPLKIIGKSYTQNDEALNQFSKEDLVYFEQVADAAYFYVQEHKNIYFYMAAQELIWNRILGDDKVYWTTENNGGGTIIDIEAYKKQLEEEMKNSFKRASFNTNKIEGKFYDVIILEDINCVLDDYEIINNSNNRIWKDYSHLYVEILSSEPTTIKLVKKTTSMNQTKGYTSSSSQLIAELGYYDNYQLEFQINATDQFNSHLNINFLDKEKKLSVDGEIQFKLYDKINQTYIGDIYETFNGNFMSNFSVEEGDYRLEVLNVPKNYVIGEPLDFNIREEDMFKTDFLSYYTLDYYLELAIGTIVVETTGNDDKSYKYQLIVQENIFNQFQNLIYKKGDIINEFELKNDENISLEGLPLGNYIIKNIDNSKEYSVSLDYIDPFTKNVIAYIEIENNIILDKPNIPEENPNPPDDKENSKSEELGKIDSSENKNDISNIEKYQKELPNTSNYRKKYYHILLAISCISILGFIIPKREKIM